MHRDTIFSPCRRYRYTLWREWDMFNASYLMVVGLNPSKADGVLDDNTVRRCIDFARRWGFGALCMTNLFAWRDTRPERMEAAAEPVGADNDAHLLRVAEGAGLILAAWGVHGVHLGRAAEVLALLHGNGLVLHHLRGNADGSPMHPLYVAADTKPTIYVNPSYSEEAQP